jgi:hypothetical protein
MPPKADIAQINYKEMHACLCVSALLPITPTASISLFGCVHNHNVHNILHAKQGRSAVF